MIEIGQVYWHHETQKYWVIDRKHPSEDMWGIVGVSSAYTNIQWFLERQKLTRSFIHPNNILPEFLP